MRTQNEKQAEASSAGSLLPYSSTLLFLTKRATRITATAGTRGFCAKFNAHTEERNLLPNLPAIREEERAK